jgi:hypothetical protein
MRLLFTRDPESQQAEVFLKLSRAEKLFKNSKACKAFLKRPIFNQDILFWKGFRSFFSFFRMFFSGSHSKNENQSESL